MRMFRIIGVFVLSTAFFSGCGSQEFAPITRHPQPARRAPAEAQPREETPAISAIRATDNFLYDSSPSWSPDGKSLAFTSFDEGGAQNIWIVEVDLSNVFPVPSGEARRLTSGEFIDRDPSWSPREGRIIFSSNRAGAFSLFTVDVSTGEIAGLGVEGIQPRWSPVDDRIAYVHQNNIWMLHPSRDNQKQLITESGFNEFPAWSPDGSTLIFSSNYNIKTADAATGGRTPLTSSAWNSQPDWCAANNRIVFVSGRGGRYDLWTMRPDGLGLRQLSETAHHEKFPAWSPDGKWIAFQADYEGGFDIWLKAAD